MALIVHFAPKGMNDKKYAEVLRRLDAAGAGAPAGRLPRSRDALEGHDVLVYETLGGMPGFEWMRDASHGGRIAFRANDPEALVGAATAGLGLCAAPCACWGILRRR